VLVLKDLSNLWADSVEEPSLSLDVANINIEGPGDAFLRYASLNRLANHPVFLDHRDAIDALVIGKCLVVS
jgi:hypothetical protein